MNISLYASQFNFKGDRFRQFLMLSALVHASFFLLYGVKVLLWPNQTIIIPNAVRVDIVGMPDKIEKPTPAPAPAEEAKPAPKVETKPKPEPKKVAKPKPKPKAQDLKKTKAEQQLALEKLKQMSALEKIKNEVSAHSAKTAAQTPAGPQYKGNVVTSGNSFTGLARLAAQEYWSLAKQHIQNYWALPEWLLNTNLRASVVVMINETGKVTRHEIYQSSGNKAFDDAALTAVEAASPFPVPPERLQDTITKSWMVFNFPE